MREVIEWYPKKSGYRVWVGCQYTRIFLGTIVWPPHLLPENFGCFTRISSKVKKIKNLLCTKFYIYFFIFRVRVLYTSQYNTSPDLISLATFILYELSRFSLYELILIIGRGVKNSANITYVFWSWNRKKNNLIWIKSTDLIAVCAEDVGYRTP